MSLYIDGFVIPLKKDKVEAYRSVASKCAAIWKEHGALEYIEALGDDLEVKDMVSFPQLAHCAEDETVVFAWAVFASREARDAANAGIMADPRMTAIMESSGQNIDCKRMAYGGFKVIVQG